MLKRNWALIAFCYLAIAEALSWMPVSDLSLCLLHPETHAQAADYNNDKYCPAFHTGIIAAFNAVDGILERHDKSLVAGFTVVLAISTIGLWLATNKLWAAGEKQFGLLASISERQSCDMQASIEAAKQSADAATLSARAAISLQLPVFQIFPDDLAWGDTRTGEDEIRAHCHVNTVRFQNIGATRAIPIKIRYDYTLGQPLPAEPNYSFEERFLPENIFEPDPKTTLRKRLSGDIEMLPEDWPLICNGTKDVWFYCDFVFEDFMEVRHSVSFCWKWSHVGHGMAWRRDRSPAYNRKT